MRICELKDKEVINSNDCKILGFVEDVDFDTKTGCILSLIVPGPCKLFGILGRDIEYVIPYRCVIQIGPDVVLVNVCISEITKKTV